MVDTARTGTGDDVRHAAVVEAVAFAAERLLLATDWREAADEVLERMGLAAGVSRAYVIENHPDEQGRLLGTMRHEWCAPGVSSQALNPFLQAAPWHDALGSVGGDPCTRRAHRHAHRGTPGSGTSGVRAPGHRVARRAPDLRRRRMVGRDRVRRLRAGAPVELGARRPARRRDRDRRRRHPPAHRTRPAASRAAVATGDRAHPGGDLHRHRRRLRRRAHGVRQSPDEGRARLRARAVPRGAALLVLAHPPRGPGEARGLGRARCRRRDHLRRGLPHAGGRRRLPVDPRHLDPGASATTESSITSSGS